MKLSHLLKKQMMGWVQERRFVESIEDNRIDEALSILRSEIAESCDENRYVVGIINIFCVAYVK